MSFGISVSDFIKVIELAYKIRKDFVGAPEQFKAISDEVRSLSIVLQDIEVVLSEDQLTTKHEKRLHDIVEGCRNVLDRLEKTLQKYHELSSEAGKKRYKKVWKRLIWEPEEIHELRSRISSNIALLNVFNSGVTRDNTVKLIRHQDEQEFRTILGWLTSLDYGTQQSDFLSRRQEGTGRWLLESDQFQSWSKDEKQTLYCPGIPGAGKTIITSIVVDALCTKFQNDANVGIAYIYCNFRRQQEQKPVNLLASLLDQLIQRQASMPESIKTLYKRHNHGRTRPSVDEISNVLHSVVADYPKTFIIVDALDECQNSDGCRKRLLSEIFSLQNKTGACFFATSRFIPEIGKEFEGSISINIHATNEDVKRYLDGHMSQLPSTVLRNSDLQEEIKTGIIKAVDGMFLLAQLHLDSLIGKRSPKAIRLALRNLHKELEASNKNNITVLDQAYEQAMKRIEGQVTDSHVLAKQVLSWIACAKRPLTVLELRHALAVEIGESEFDEENMPQIEDAVSVCAGLVTVDEESGIIRLVHYTAQEYFERTQISWFPNAENDIAMACISYLSFDIFKTGFCSTDEEFEKRLRINPLYHYAAQNWGHHSHAFTSELERLVLNFLDSAAKVAASSQAMLAFKRYSEHSGYSQEVPRHMTGVHFAAHFGLEKLLSILLQNGHNPCLMDSHRQTPLLWASKIGQEQIVKMLLATDNVDSDHKDLYDRTPLSWATINGHESIVRLLLATGNVDLDHQDRFGRTSLSIAVRHGHESIVSLLLATGNVDLNQKDMSGQTLLLTTIENGNESIMRLLLATDNVDLNHNDMQGKTSLLVAATNGHESIVRLLLATDNVDLDHKNMCGQTSLLLAAANGHESIVRLLLATGNVDLDHKDMWGQTSLLLTAANGHESIVRLLLATGNVDLDHTDDSRRTPLLWAAAKGHESIVRLLLATGNVDLDHKDMCGQTSLLLAAANGHESIVRLLLTTGNVDLDHKDDLGRTPLLWAAAIGHKSIVRLLLATGNVDLDYKDLFGWTALSYAACARHEAVVKLLLATNGIDPDSKNKHDRTPLLLFAAKHKRKAEVKLLLAQNGVNPNITDGYSNRPLLLAAELGLDEVVELLLRRNDVNPNITDKDGNTALLLAAELGHDEVVELLLRRNDVNPNITDKDGNTPLLMAARNGWEAVVKLLLARKDVNPDCKDNRGRTPLSMAASRGHETVVRLLLATNGVDLASKDQDEVTPLLRAVDGGHRNIMQLLVQKYKENGIAIHDDDGSVTTCLAWFGSRIVCDICDSDIPITKIHYHCGICNDGDFDICQKCVACGAFCLDPAHKLVKRLIGNDNDAVVLPAAH